MNAMRITTISDTHFRVEVADRFIDEEVNDVQFLGMAMGHFVGTTAEEILAHFEEKPIGHVMTLGDQ